jgi:hypothetical protein
LYFKNLCGIIIDDMGKPIKLILVLEFAFISWGWGLEHFWIEEEWKYYPAPGKDSEPVFMETVIITGDPMFLDDDLRRFEEYLKWMAESNEIIIQAVNNNRWYKVEIDDNGEILLNDYLNGEKIPLTLQALGALEYLSTPVNLLYYPKSPQQQVVDNNNAISNACWNFSPYTGPLPEDSPSWLKNVPWHLIQDGVNYVRDTYGVNLGPWEAYLMAAIWQAEGAKLETAFGIRRYDNPYDKAEECAATIYKNINRFWQHVNKIETDPLEAEQFGKTLVATAALELYRAGEDVFEYFGRNVLGSLVPGYLNLLNEGSEPNITGGIKRLNYARFLLDFIPSDFNGDYRRVARYFVQKFREASHREQFLMFATFFLPYEGMNHSSGYCPIWDMGGSYWRGAYEEKPGHFELNSNWGMNVYSYLSYLIDRAPSVPVNFFTSGVSYF